MKIFHFMFTFFAISAATAYGISSNNPSPVKFTTCDNATKAKLYGTPDQWILTESELRDNFPELTDNLARIKNLSDALRTQGVTLVPLILPLRPMIAGNINAGSQAEMKAYNRALAVTNYEKIVLSLNKLRIPTPNLVRAMRNQQDDMFFRGDHHITPQGGQVIASTTAKLFEKSILLKDIPKNVYSTTSNGVLTHPDPSRSGALVGLCGPQPQETIHLLKTVLVSDQAGLLDDIIPRVVYVGTSNGRDTWNLKDSLQQAFGLDVLDAHIDAGGAYTPLLNYLISKNYTDSRPAIIVWEWSLEEIFYGRDGALLFNVPETYQEVIPAVYGDCSKENLLFSSAAPISESVSFPIQVSLLDKSSYFVLKYTDLSIPKIKLTIVDASGQSITSDYNIGSRQTNRGELFAQVPADQKNISSLVLSFPSISTGSVEAHLCQVARK